MNPTKLLPLLLLGVLLLPLAAAAIVWWLGRARGMASARSAAAYLAAGHLILTAVLSAFAVGMLAENRVAPSSRLVAAFQPVAVPGDPGLTGTEPLSRTTWTILSLALPSSGSLEETAVRFFIGLDGLSLPLVVLTSLMVFLAVLVSWESAGERAGDFYGWIFLLQAACIGAFVSLDLLLFYVFFELTLLPAFFLIGCWGLGGGRRDAARVFLLYTLLGSLLTLVGLLGVAVMNPTPLGPQGERLRAGAAGTVMPLPGPVTFSIPELMENVHVWDEAHAAEVGRAEVLGEGPRAAALEAQSHRRMLLKWLFFALMAGFAVKIPIVPLHTWLPGAYSEAPLGVTMLFSAILAKLGAFGVLRIAIPLMPEQAVLDGLQVFGTLGAIGIVYAAFCAFAQRDLKQLAAYSSVSHLGFLVLGLFALTPESLTGAALHLINHGLTAGALFALLAVLFDRYRLLDVYQYGGLWNRMPRFTFFFILFALALVGVPGLNNFPSEMLMLAGLFDPRNVQAAGLWLAAAAAAGLFLSAWYVFTAVRRLFFGLEQRPEQLNGVADLTGREVGVLGVLAASCLWLGLAPQPLINIIAPDAERVVSTVEAARKRLHTVQLSPAEERNLERLRAPAEPNLQRPGVQAEPN